MILKISINLGMIILMKILNFKNILSKEFIAFKIFILEKK